MFRTADRIGKSSVNGSAAFWVLVGDAERKIEVANFERIESTGLASRYAFGDQISSKPSGIQAKTASFGEKNVHFLQKKRNFLAILFTFY